MQNALIYKLAVFKDGKQYTFQNSVFLLDQFVTKGMLARHFFCSCSVTIPQTILKIFYLEYIQLIALYIASTLVQC